MNVSTPFLRLLRRARTLVAATPVILILGASAANAQRLPQADVNDGQTFRVIAFHDVRENVRATFEHSPEPTAVDERTLSSFFAWLKASDHTPVSLEQIVQARAGGAALPPGAVLLTFDDGYESTYTKVFPLLKLYGYPAVVALVTEWIENPPQAVTPAPEINAPDAPARPGLIQAHSNVTPTVALGASETTPLTPLALKPPDRFMTWAQAREMADSGLVELASHSHAMHRGRLANPQGNVQPAAGAFVFDPATQRYETVDAQRARIEQDLRRSRTLIERHTGARVRAMVWPYGSYTQPALEAAARAGMPITFTLGEGPNTADVPLARIRRGLATFDMPVPDYTLLRAPEGDGVIFPLNRAMHIDLDYVYDPDPVQQEANLSLLLERVLAVGPSSVFLQAFADPDGDGAADALYFPNRHLPVRADLFNRVAWQLRTRTGVQVYAWMPVMAFQLPTTHPLANKLVSWTGEPPSAGQSESPSAAPEGVRYHRLTPFDPAVRDLIGDIYEDLGKHAVFAGVLFHDDALLGDDEDQSAAALDTYERWGLPRDINAIKADPDLRRQWAEKKTRFLTDFTLALADRVDYWRPDIVTARNLYARPVMQAEAGEWFSQDFAQSLQAYDYTAVMAMPYMEQAVDPDAWLTTLVERVAAQPNGLARTVFQIQARDWRTGQPVPDETMAEQWALMHRLGARHLAYYPDDFHNNQPGLATLRRALSIRSTLQDDTDTLDTPPALTPPRPTPLILPVDETPLDRPSTSKVPAQ